ncbi:MAG: peptidoglycan DD-metalloendopeptidase family protein [Patescibacteria group bacterium]
MNAGDTWLFSFPLNSWYEPNCDFNCHVNDPEFPRPGGNDYPCGLGTAVLAAEDGQVTFAGWNPNGYGNLVKIQHDNGYETYYAHCSELYVSAGQYVTQGSLIAASGNTGWVIGDPGYHLHFEVRQNGTPIDPYNTSHWLWATSPPTLYSELSYSGTYVGKSHSSTLVLLPGSTVNCWIDFRCNPPLYWSSNGNSSHYVALHSVANNWTDMENSPVIAGSSNFLDDDGSAADPNGVARFNFMVTAPSTPGTYTLRTRVYHPYTESFITGTGSDVMFTVEVVNPDPTPDSYADLAILYDYGSCQTRAHVFTSTGTTFNNYATWRQQYSYCLSAVKFTVEGDYDGDGDGDIAMVYSYGNNTIAIHCFMSAGNAFAYEPYWWSASLALSSVKNFVSGDFDGDGDDDLAFVKDWGSCNTRIHVLKSNGNGAFAYQGDAGWWAAPGWYCASAVRNILSGDLNRDGKDDIAMSYRYGAQEAAFHCFLSTGRAFSYRPNWWHSSYFSLDLAPRMVMGDFSGDGKADIIAAYRYGAYHTAFHAFLSSGSAFLYRPYWFNSTGYGLDFVKHLVAADFNDDGKDDIATAYQYGTCTTKLHRFISTGSSMTYEGIKWSSSSYCLSAAKYMAAGNFNAVGFPKIAQPEEDRGPLPTAFTLSQNYPNPFNAATIISYALPEAAHVELHVYNILGQKVTTLVDEYQTAGQHEISWAADQHASGIYFYRIRAGDAVESKKMVLLK